MDYTTGSEEGGIAEEPPLKYLSGLTAAACIALHYIALLRGTELGEAGEEGSLLTEAGVISRGRYIGEYAFHSLSYLPDGSNCILVLVGVAGG